MTKHTITYLSTRAKNLPPTRGRSWRHIPASHCPRCSCGWLGMWTSDGPSLAEAVGKHLEEMESPEMTAVLGKPIAPKVSNNDPYGIKAEAAVDAYQESKTPRWRR